jgi:hypothetical protein
MKARYHFEDVDTWERDAILVIDGERYCFQLKSNEPSLGDALEDLFLSGQIKIIKDTGW